MPRKFVTEQMALDHLHKAIEAGRPKPTRSLVYFIGGDEGPVKIGHTTRLHKRLTAIQACSPVALRVLATMDGRGRDWETIYHHRYAAHRLHGEWFERVPEIQAEIDRLSAGPVPPKAEVTGSNPVGCAIFPCRNLQERGANKPRQRVQVPYNGGSQ